MGTPDPASRSWTRHIGALDGLRGLAAIVVVARHALGAVELPAGVDETIMSSPLVVFLNASGAVQLFFVLSGCVLAASLSRNRTARELPQYFIRRVFRIHPPYVFAVLFAWSASLFYVQATPDSGVGVWPRLLGRIHLSLPQLGKSLLFPGPAYNQLSVGWSLEVEMVFSFLMPLLLAIAGRTHWLLLVALCCLPLGVGDSGLPVLKFALDFAVGVALFRERERLARRLGGLRGGGAALYGVAAMAVFVSPWLLGWNPSPAGDPFSIVVTAVGAAALTAGGAFIPGLGRLLSGRVCLFLGRVSYSLYLLHYPILLLVVPRVVAAPTDGMQPVLLFGAVLSIALPLSALSYRFVERPAIRVGNAVCAWAARFGGVRFVGSRLASSAGDTERFAARARL